MIRALAVVAHPDDCIIFARAFIEHTDCQWNILYLTYKDTDPRAQEVRQFWNKHNIGTIFLDHRDTHLDLENWTLSFDHLQAHDQIVDACADYDIILTHGPNGEYHHPHHLFVHNVVVQSGKPMVHFAFGKQFEGSIELVASELDLNVLPLHRSVIEQFVQINTGHYVVSESAAKLLGESS